MGRKAGTHGTPIESAMEKYHSDIGSRLSGVFVPQTNSDLSEDFCQLTLDTRHRNSIKVKRAEAPVSTPLTTYKSSSSGVSTSSSTHSEHESATKDKTRLVDKLTRALFQKKHMCARCQRRSRSCLPNKSFTHREKRYTCATCRQQSHAVRHLFGQSVNKLSSSYNKQSTTSKGLSEVTAASTEHPQHRTQNTDSGYDTVTSCSTVSSASSAFTNTFNSSKGNSQQCEPDSQSQIYKAPEITKPRNVPNITNSPHFHLKGLAQDGQLCLDPNPKEQKLGNAYDGYLPDIDYERLEKYLLTPTSTPLQDATNFEGRTFHEHPTKDTMVKACYTCSATNKICFRLPWEGGWLCEDCLDRVH
ncbi:uncharacterized protein LOC106050829 [Biomphalaria glabrata]|uniref:Uncharacterized protein LOC106050829 n=1 Tax=Biomphalaria glabrata TaxID=6526 RepID=A0A9U8DVA5_BIOGL|nr:uncharacterized protein LOC106050829 [Biomphalaria glabrata]